MNILIAGAGELGLRLASELIAEGRLSALCLSMLIGRLETSTFIVMFTPINRRK